MRNRNLARVVLFVVGAGLYTGYMQQPNMGHLKLESVDKDASVYVDGAFAGSAQKLRDNRQGSFRQRVRVLRVLSGKTLAIHPKLQPEEAK